LDRQQTYVLGEQRTSDPSDPDCIGHSLFLYCMADSDSSQSSRLNDSCRFT
jgi:hypothetical protein